MYAVSSLNYYSCIMLIHVGRLLGFGSFYLLFWLVAKNRNATIMGMDEKER